MCPACIDDDDTATAEATPRRVRVLILFNGHARPLSIKKYLLEMDADVETYELLDDPVNQDLKSEQVQGSTCVLARVAGGEFDAVFMAPPCASFCLALQPILRSLRWPTLWACTRLHVSGGRTCACITGSSSSRLRSAWQLSERAGAAWMIENPASRRSGAAFWREMSHRASMWDMPVVLDLCKRTGAVPLTAAQCQFESEYQK